MGVRLPAGGPATRPRHAAVGRGRRRRARPLPTAGYTVEPGTTTRSGLARLPALARESYAGISYQGVDD